MSDTCTNNTYTKDKDTLVLAWTSADIVDHAYHNMNLGISLEEARKVLRLLEDSYDSDSGINNFSIANAIEEIVSPLDWADGLRSWVESVANTNNTFNTEK